MDNLLMFLSPFGTLLGLYLLTTGIINSGLIFSGIVWGISVPATDAQKAFTGKARLSLIGGIVLIALCAPGTFMSLLDLLFGGDGILILVYIALWIAVILGSTYLAQKKTYSSKLLLEENNAKPLETLPFVQAVEAQLDQAQSFVVSFEGIALANNMNYCYAVELYEEYQMGALESASEVALIGLYFVQKYHDQFNFKVDMERIPGTPGQTVTFIGSSGVNFGYTKGTAPQAIFRSYIFTRK